MKRLRSLKIRKIKSSEFNTVIDLRQNILHPGGERSRVLYPFDDHKETIHLGVFTEDPDAGNLKLAACGTLLPEAENLKFSTSVCRIRGMAVDANFQKKGLGQMILNGLLEEALKNKRSKVWCNARSSVLNFYLSKGFVKEGFEFILPPNIPHYKLIKVF